MNVTHSSSGEALKPKRNQLFNLPNVLTYGRIICVPLVVGCLFWPEEFWMRWLAFAIFAAAGVTDYFDGYLARAWREQSSLGRMLDPIADKVLVAACLLMLVADRTIASWSIWAAIIILAREILVSGLREFLAELQVSVPVSKLAKWKTTVQILAVGFLVVGQAGDVLMPVGWTWGIGIGLLWAAAILTLYTGYDYFRAGLQHVFEQDAS
jgi:cardiolipin synthase (CMP-forming)